MNAKTALFCIYQYWKKSRLQVAVDQKAVQRKLLKLYVIYKKIKERENIKEKQKIKFWVRPIFKPERRFLQGASDNLIVEMLSSNDPKYCNFLRLSPILFEKLLEIVGPKIQKQYAVRDPIPPRTRLELTLRYDLYILFFNLRTMYTFKYLQKRSVYIH